MKSLHLTVILVIISFNTLFAFNENEKISSISLAGEWELCLDSSALNNISLLDFNLRVNLPGTLDAAGIGKENKLLPEMKRETLLHLQRKHEYIGKAWYRKIVSIPESAKNEELILILERVLWKSTVYIDNKEVGSEYSLSVPHKYNLTKFLSPGNHEVLICIDNTKQFDLNPANMAHAYTNETQVIWNGVIGDLSLKMVDKISIKNVNIYPDIDRKGARVVIDVINTTGKPANGTIKLSALIKGKILEPKFEKFEFNGEQGKVECFYSLGNDMELWSEFNPNLYTLNVALNSGKMSDEVSTTFGMRKLTNENGYLQINGTRIFLRGTLECCIFPLTGNPPMDQAGWRKVFGTAKQWGLNHLRFHSWCPPEVAFEVADEMGFYLQIELPLWSLTVGKDTATTRFITNEAQRISVEYGNHPSFCLWSMGNELEGDVNILTSLVNSLKAQDNRHLYMTTTFSFQKGLGTQPQPCDDYFVTQWTDKGWIRGQGIFNSEPPSFDKNYSKPLQGIEVPVISHEIGQYSVYPDIKEIEKYKGSLVPLNFIAIRDDLKKKGLLSKAEDFLHSSGKLAAILYKEEIERAMKTPEFSGFQLLDLHDFPGQGTALVGLLDAFWDSKGIISPGEFKSFCGPVVPLLNFPKAVYLNSDTFEASACFANFTDKLMSKKRLIWTLSKKDGEEFAKGAIDAGILSIGYNADLGKIIVPLQKIKQAQQLNIQLSLEGTTYHNSWNIWVYPSDLKIDKGDIVVTPDIQVAKKALEDGKKVLFNPNWRKIKGIEGKFVPVFWSPVHFPKQAGTMGVLCNPSSLALADFPTDSFSDWQWWDLNINSTTIVLDSFPAVTPLVEMIDNLVNNRHLATIFEAKVGKGSLIFSSIDVISNLENRPVAKQLLYSLLSYMKGTSFKPLYELGAGELDRFITTKTNENAKKKSEDIY